MAAENGPEARTGERSPLTDDDLEQLAALLSPLANPTRLRLLRFLTRPRYLEEIASHLQVSRQAARKHVDQLLGIGAVDRLPGSRGSGPVVDYVTNPQALFVIHDHFEKLGKLDPQQSSPVLARTALDPGRRSRDTVLEGVALSVVRGMLSGRRFRLDDPSERGWTLGRDPRCEVILPYDPWISNRHAEIRPDNDGYVLTDLRSTNGTRHNWTLLPRGGTVGLQHGDILAVGRTNLVFWNR